MFAAALLSVEKKVMASESKYARIEFERRFLLERLPADVKVVAVRRIVDRYIEGTRLRLREIIDPDGAGVYKLAQKIPDETPTTRQGMITNFYLSRDEFGVLSRLPAKILRKTRHSVPPFGIDVFEDALDGLVMAEAEFTSAEEAASLEIPSFIAAEVTKDRRFAGGSLVAVTLDELRAWLAEYGIELSKRSR